MSHLKHRLARLERAQRPTICLVCGLDLRGPIAVTVHEGGPDVHAPAPPYRGCRYPLTIAVDLFTPLDPGEVDAVGGKASR